VFNGDIGITVRDGGRLAVAFETAEGVRLIGPAQLPSSEPVHAMTIHKSQGSEFDHIVVVLPSATSPLATRELLYTAVTRARRSVTVVGDVESVRTATQRRELRVSGLADRLSSATGGHGLQTSSPPAPPHQ
ncbi:MAG: ATP-binding domain-containing protein, partial [Ilumatobacteraceae bacterium]